MRVLVLESSISMWCVCKQTYFFMNLEMCESHWLNPWIRWTVRITLKIQYSPTFENHSTFMYYNPSEWGRETIILCLPCILCLFSCSYSVEVMNCRFQVFCDSWRSPTETYIRPLSLDTFDPLIHEGKWVLFFKDVGVFLWSDHIEAFSKQ